MYVPTTVMEAAIDANGLTLSVGKLSFHADALSAVCVAEGSPRGISYHLFRCVVRTKYGTSHIRVTAFAVGSRWGFSWTYA
jgi:hypothetical protein